MYVLYDAECGMCCRAVRRLLQEPSYFPVRFAPASAPGIAARFGAAIGDGQQLVVVSDVGEVWRGTSAWIMVLYAMRRWRPLAMRLARPGWRPLAARAIGAVSRNRRGISEMFGWAPDVGVLRETRASARGGDEQACPGGACERPLNSGRDGRALDELIRARQRVRAGLEAGRTEPPPLPLNG
jgi:predicted DCC family thiol-disulfide oxidoreductase YuxK